MKNWNFLFIFLMISFVEVRVKAQSNQAIVIGIKKSIRLKSSDDTQKDYIISGGPSMGLVKGQIVDVRRRVPIHDTLQNKALGDLKVKVGELEIIHAEGSISVARLYAMESAGQRPVLDYDSIMVGDRLDLKTLRAKPQYTQVDDTFAKSE